MTAVTRFLALGYPRWPLQGQKAAVRAVLQHPLCPAKKMWDTITANGARGQVSGVASLYSPILRSTDDAGSFLRREEELERGPQETLETEVHQVEMIACREVIGAHRQQ